MLTLRSVFALGGLTAAALLVSASVLPGQHPQPRIPPGTHEYEAYLIQQEHNRLNSSQPGTAWPGSSLYPWRRPGYRGYSEPAQSRPSSWATTAAPRKYTITVETLPQTVAAPDAKAAYVMAHVPEAAAIWFQGQLMTDTGDMRLFRSPPLTVGADYQYEIRVAWPEEGKWVAQTKILPVHAGQIHCLYIAPSEEVAAGEKGAENKILQSLAKLSPADRKLAEQQKFCAVQNKVRLGSMGTPARIVVNGEPVFLCCTGCTELAQANPEQTLAKVRQLRAGGKAGKASLP